MISKIHFPTQLDVSLKKHEYLKKRYVRANHALFINKTIVKETVKQSRLRNKFLSTNSEKDRKACNKQSKYCISLIRKAMQTFFGNINTTEVT